jgi:dolichol-phosphate mannosyltransferase
METAENVIENESVTCLMKSSGSTQQSAMLSIIVPTYNESENIVELVTKIESLFAFFNFEIIIVDDNSPDGTSLLAQQINGNYGNIRIIKRPGKLGLSSAVLQGFDLATADVVSVIDADLQHPPQVLLEMYEKMSKGYDLVVASRYVEGGGIEGWTFKRRIVSRVATLLAHLLFPKSKKVKDVMSGCFMIRRDILEGKSLNPIGFKVLLEILVNRKIDLIVEVPYIFVNRRNGKSNLSPKEMSNFVIHLCRLIMASSHR